MAPDRPQIIYPDTGQSIAFHRALMAHLGIVASEPIDERAVGAVVGRMTKIIQDGEGDIFWIAAELLFDTVRTKPFGPGSDQTAIAFALAFLLRNGIMIVPPEEEEIRGVGLAIADGSVYVAMVEEWLRQCARPVPPFMLVPR